MAKKPTISTITSGFTSSSSLNTTLQALRDAFDNTVSRDGSTPNSMSADLDLNNNDILNANSIQANQFNVGGSALDITDLQALDNIGTDVTTLAHLEDGTVLTNGLSDLASNVDTLVTNLDGLNSFAERYNVSATAPTSPNEGDLWYDTVNNVLKYYDGSSWTTTAGVSADEKTKISSNDTTEDFLINKLAAGSNISLTETNDGANETLSVAVTGLGALATLNTVSASEIDSNAVTTSKILDSNVTLAKLEDMAQNEFMMRVTASTGAPEHGTAAQALAALGFEIYVSSTGTTTVAGNNQYSEAHGLSAKPDIVTAFLECTSADLNYSVGDRVWLPFNSVQSFGGQSQTGTTLGADSTNVFCAQDSTILIVNKTGLNVGAIDSTKWEIFFVAVVLP